MPGHFEQIITSTNHAATVQKGAWLVCGLTDGIHLMDNWEWLVCQGTLKRVLHPPVTCSLSSKGAWFVCKLTNDVHSMNKGEGLVCQVTLNRV